jgi:hypothetical protein
MLVSRDIVLMNICVYFCPPSIVGTLDSVVSVATSSLWCWMFKAGFGNLKHLQRMEL